MTTLTIPTAVSTVAAILHTVGLTLPPHVMDDAVAESDRLAAARLVLITSLTVHYGTTIRTLFVRAAADHHTVALRCPMAVALDIAANLPDGVTADVDAALGIDLTWPRTYAA